jgi:hypothetical protein
MNLMFILRPWSSAFWVSPLQRNLIKHLMKTGGFKYTNTEEHRRQLENLGFGRMALIPNFSTMREPSVLPSFSKRGNDVIVFGRSDQRRVTYARGSDALSSLCRYLRLKRIIDIGDPIEGDTKTHIDGVPIIRCGRLQVEAINRWMSTSVASFIGYPVPMLCKSSVYAVSCAHGAIPFICDSQGAQRSCPGLIAGEDYVAMARYGGGVELPRLDLLSAKVFSNYQARSSTSAARKIANYIFGTGSSWSGVQCIASEQ